MLFKSLSGKCPVMRMNERSTIMDKRRGLTRTEVLVIIVVVAFIALIVIGLGIGAAILLPELQKPREQGKRAVCLNNLRQLNLAWILYADENDDKLVNGAPLGIQCQANLGSGDQRGERPWTGRDWAKGWAYGEQLPEECQKSAIRAGALWPYCQELKLYRCPTGYPGQMRNYAIVDSMNGLARSGTKTAGVWIKNRMRISKPVDRAVFIDEGWVTPDSFAVSFPQALWWEPPPVRHKDGATLSFADGHSEYWKWKGTETIELGREWDIGYGGLYRPSTPEGMEDLQRLQKAVWGKLGYTPGVSH
jgi:prepilin-type processing-associated H-X9-DG protein